MIHVYTLNDIKFYKHPTLFWLWFGRLDTKKGKLTCDRIACYSAKIVPDHSNKWITSDKPERPLSGKTRGKKYNGQRFVETQHKGFAYSITFIDGYTEAKKQKSKKVLRHLQKKGISSNLEDLRGRSERTSLSERRSRLFSEILSNPNPDRYSGPPRDEGYELFDIREVPIPWYYTQVNRTKIDYSIIKQLESGIWTIKSGNCYLGGYETALSAWESFQISSHGIQ